MSARLFLSLATACLPLVVLATAGSAQSPSAEASRDRTRQEVGDGITARSLSASEITERAKRDLETTAKAMDLMMRRNGLPVPAPAVSPAKLYTLSLNVEDEALGTLAAADIPVDGSAPIRYRTTSHYGDAGKAGADIRSRGVLFDGWVSERRGHVFLDYTLTTQGFGAAVDASSLEARIELEPGRSKVVKLLSGATARWATLTLTPLAPANPDTASR